MSVAFQLGSGALESVQAVRRFRGFSVKLSEKVRPQGISAGGVNQATLVLRRRDKQEVTGK